MPGIERESSPVDVPSENEEVWDQRQCPHLPPVNRRLTPEWTSVHRGKRDAEFYLAALEYGQSLWSEGRPAQAILQLNKAWSADLSGSEPILNDWPLPYRALRWILINAPAERFLGNPVRHFQHLATRVSGERVELRSWRAWACFHISRLALPERDFPPDLLQIEKEDLMIPGTGQVLESLECRGVAGEAALFDLVLSECEA